MQTFFIFQINKLNYNRKEDCTCAKNLVQIKFITHFIFCFFKIKQSCNISDTQQPISPKGAFLVTKQSKNQQNQCDSGWTPVA